MVTVCEPVLVWPDHQVSQEAMLRALATRYQGHPQLDQGLRLARNTGVRTRYFAVPLEAILAGEPEPFGRRNARYLELAVDLGTRAAKGALAAARLTPAEIDTFIAVSCTGYCLPAVDAHIANALGLPPTVRRLPIQQLGCAAGGSALAQAVQYLRAYPYGNSSTNACANANANAYVASGRPLVGSGTTAAGTGRGSGQARWGNALVVAVELCSLSFQPAQTALGDWVSNGLFGDACGACVVRGDDQAAGPRPFATLQHLLPASVDTVAGTTSEAGFHFITSADVRHAVPKAIPAIRNFLARHGVASRDLQWVVCHTGGPAVLQAVQAGLELDRDLLALSWQSLAEVGNCSSVTVLDVLQRTFAQRQPADASLGLVLAFGPGFTTEALLATWRRWPPPPVRCLADLATALPPPVRRHRPAAPPPPPSPPSPPPAAGMAARSSAGTADPARALLSPQPPPRPAATAAPATRFPTTPPTTPPATSPTASPRPMLSGPATGRHGDAPRPQLQPQLLPVAPSASCRQHGLGGVSRRWLHAPRDRIRHASAPTAAEADVQSSLQAASGRSAGGDGCGGEGGGGGGGGVAGVAVATSIVLLAGVVPGPLRALQVVGPVSTWMIPLLVVLASQPVPGVETLAAVRTPAATPTRRSTPTATMMMPAGPSRAARGVAVRAARRATRRRMLWQTCALVTGAVVLTMLAQAVTGRFDPHGALTLSPSPPSPPSGPSAMLPVAVPAAHSASSVAPSRLPSYPYTVPLGVLTLVTLLQLTRVSGLSGLPLPPTGTGQPGARSSVRLPARLLAGPLARPLGALRRGRGPAWLLLGCCVGIALTAYQVLVNWQGVPAAARHAIGLRDPGGPIPAMELTAWLVTVALWQAAGELAGGWPPARWKTRPAHPHRWSRWAGGVVANIAVLGGGTAAFAGLRHLGLGIPTIAAVDGCGIAGIMLVGDLAGGLLPIGSSSGHPRGHPRGHGDTPSGGGRAILPAGQRCRRQLDNVLAHGLVHGVLAVLAGIVVWVGLHRIGDALQVWPPTVPVDLWTVICALNLVGGGLMWSGWYRRGLHDVDRAWTTGYTTLSPSLTPTPVPVSAATASSPHTVTGGNGRNVGEPCRCRSHPPCAAWRVHCRCRRGMQDPAGSGSGSGRWAGLDGASAAAVPAPPQRSAQHQPAPREGCWSWPWAHSYELTTEPTTAALAHPHPRAYE